MSTPMSINNQMMAPSPYISRMSFMQHAQQQPQHSQQPPPHQQQQQVYMNSTFSQPYSSFTNLGNPNLAFPNANTRMATPLMSGNPMNDYYDQNIQRSQENTETLEIGTNEQPLGSSIPDHSKSLASLSVADLIPVSYTHLTLPTKA